MLWGGGPGHASEIPVKRNPLFLKAIVSLKGKTWNSYGYIGNSDIEYRLSSQKRLKNPFELLLEASFKAKKHCTADYEYGYSLNRAQTVFNI